MAESDRITTPPKLMHVDVIQQDWLGARTKRLTSYRLDSDYGPHVTDPHPISECPFGDANELPMRVVKVDPPGSFRLPARPISAEEALRRGWTWQQWQYALAHPEEAADG